MLFREASGDRYLACKKRFNDQYLLVSLYLFKAPTFKKAFREVAMQKNGTTHLWIIKSN